MELKNVLQKMKVADLKKEISKTNIRGYSKLRKDEIIKMMLEYESRFMHLLEKHKPKDEPKQSLDKPKKEPEEEKDEGPTKEDKKQAKKLFKMIVEFKKEPNQKLLDKINAKAEFIDFIPESDRVFQELMKEVKKFRASKKKKVKSKKQEEPKPKDEPKPKENNNLEKIIKELTLLNNFSDEEKEYIRPDKVYRFIDQWRKEEIKQFNETGYNDEIVVENVLEMFYKLLDDAGKYGVEEVEEDLDNFINVLLPELPESRTDIRPSLSRKLTDSERALDKNKIVQYKNLNNKTINKLIKSLEFKRKLIRKAMAQINKNRY